MHWRQVHAHCNVAAKPYWANRRLITFRTYVSNARDLWSRAAASTSKPSQPRSVMSMEQHCEHSCANDWERVCENCVPTCAEWQKDAARVD